MIQVFRKVYQLYANVRPARTRPGVAAPSKNVDLVVIREVKMSFVDATNALVEYGGYVHGRRGVD